MTAQDEQPPPPPPARREAIEDISWDEIDKVRYFILGPAVFLGVRAAVYPSSLVKTRLQVQSRHNPVYSGTFDAFRKIWRLEGPRGLYKGFGASTANVLTGNLYISVYEKSRKVFRDHTSMGEKMVNFAGGAFASIVSQTVVVPLDIVSQRMMLNNQGVDARKSRERAKGFMSVTKDVFRREGLRGFYRGYFPSIATYAPSSSIWWGSYGLLVPVYFQAMSSWNADPFWKQGSALVIMMLWPSSVLIPPCLWWPVLAQMLSGGSAGIITGILTNPMDIVRTRTQVYTQYGAIETFKHLLKRDGPRGLMTGVSAVSYYLLQFVVSRHKLTIRGLFSLDRATRSGYCRWARRACWSCPRTSS